MASDGTYDVLGEHTHSEIISRQLKAWEDYNFKNLDLWEDFKYNFQDWTENDFRLAPNCEIRQIRNSLRRRGVWVEKSRLPIAKSLVNTLQEEVPTPWTEEEIRRCKDENFISNHINNLLQEDFGRNPRVYSTYPPPSSVPQLATGLGLGSPSAVPAPTRFFTPPLPPTMVPGTGPGMGPGMPEHRMGFGLTPAPAPAPPPAAPHTPVAPFAPVASLSPVAPLAPVTPLTSHVPQQASGQRQQPEQTVHPMPQQPLLLQQSQRKPIQYLQNSAQQPQPHVPLYESLLPIFEPPPSQFKPAKVSAGDGKRLSSNLAEVYTRNVGLRKSNGSMETATRRTR